MEDVPTALRRWFVVHFAIDVALAVPLFVAPEAVLDLLRWTPVDPIATRLVAAALVGIGVQSYLGRNGTVAEFRGMLNLKLLWSGTAIVGLAWGLLSGGPVAAAVFLAAFAAFFALWAFYRRTLG